MSTENAKREELRQHLSDEKNNRQPHAEGTHGGLTIESYGPQNDEFATDSIPVNRAEDFTLAYALGLRGYDVRLKFVSKEEGAARRARANKKKEGK